MCSTAWLETTDYLETIGFCLSTPLNLILIVLIWEMPIQKFGNYKYLMLSFSSFGIMYSGFNFWSKPMVHFADVSFIVFHVLKSRDYSKFIAEIFLSIYCSFYGMMLLLLTIHFYYRYLSVIGSYKLARFNLQILAMWTAFFILYNSVWFILCYYFHGESDMKNQIIAPDLLKIYCLKPEEYTYTGPQYFFKNNATGKFECHLSSFFSAGTICVIMSVLFSLLIYFGAKTYYHLYKLGQIARFDSQNLQKQLFQTLVIQTCIPSVFMYFPVTCLFLFPLFGVTDYGLSNFIPISVAIYPCFEPLVAIYCIKPFRMRIIAGVIKADLLAAGLSEQAADGVLKVASEFFSAAKSAAGVSLTLGLLAEKNCEATFNTPSAACSDNLAARRSPLITPAETGGNIIFSEHVALTTWWYWFFTAIWATITLFILIEKKSPKEFGGYKHFLRIYCFYAFAFSIIDWLTQPAVAIDIHGFGYAFYSENRLFDLGYTGGLSVQILYCGCFLASISFLSLNFIYRYVSICKPYYVVFFQGWRIILLFLYCTLPFFIWSMLVYTLMAPVPDRTAHLNITTMLMENVNLVNKPYVGVLCRHVTNSTEHSYGDIEWGTMSALLGFFGFQGFFYTISLVCGVLTYQDTMQLFKMAQMSKELYKMQMQLLRAIVLQASIPLILVYIPPAIMIVGGMCGIYVGQIGYFVVMSISIYPPLDSLVFLLSIRCYRSALCCHNGSEGSTGNTSVVPVKILTMEMENI